MHVRSATFADMDHLVALFEGAQAWLASKGLDQWQRPMRVEQVQRDVEAGTVFVAESDHGAVVATLTVDTFADPDFWGPNDNPSSALYVHRMIVDRHHSARGAGVALTAWVEQFAGALGYDWVRLDCWRSNSALQRYYQRQGWRYVRTVYAPWRESGALFQRPARRPPSSLQTVDVSAGPPQRRA